jgi:hypothetical protein
MTMGIFENSLVRGYLASILKLEELDEREAERIERGKEAYENSLKKLLEEEEQRKREKTERIH